MKDKSLRLFIYILVLFIGVVIALDDTEINKLNENGDAVVNTEISDFLGEADSEKDYFKLNKLSSPQVASSTTLTMNVSSDLVSLNYSSAAAFYYNTSNSYNSAINITKSGGYKNGGNGYISLKNGQYYFWTYNLNNMAIIAKGPVTITKSCKNETKSNVIGKFDVERCYVKDKSGNVKPESGATIVTCSKGYIPSNVSKTYNDCPSKNLSSGISKRYCKVVISGSCVKDPSKTPVPDAKLTALSVSSGKLSPAFKSGTKKYSVTVDSNVSSINVKATAASGSSFVSGYGSRSVKLNYGANAVKVKVKNSAGKVVTYTINVTRKDGRSTVNTLSNIKVSSGTLSPAFASNNTNYVVNVDSNVTSITVDATLTDSNSLFVSGYGPGTIGLNPGPNKIYLKIKSQNGVINVYNITVNRSTIPSECTTNTENLALLKGIEFKSDINNVEMPTLEDFDAHVFTYDDIKLPYEVSNLTVDAYVQEEGDTTLIEGTEELEVNDVREVKITVTSKVCPNYSNIYTLNVMRQPEKQLDDNAELKSLEVENHEINFERNTLDYGIKIKKGEEKLVIKFETVSGKNEKGEEKTKCEILDNENLQFGSVVKVDCTAENGEEKVTYTITVDGVEKGTNTFLLIIVVIIIVLILIYLVLRLLGYRIYFNFAVIGAFFRGIGEKIRNVFDK